MSSKLKKTARRVVVLMSVGVIAASLGGIAKADRKGSFAVAHDDFTVEPLGFWDGPKR